MAARKRRSDRQIVGEVVSGSTTTFTLAYIPVSGSLEVFGGPARLLEGATLGGYSLSGKIITPSESYSAGGITANYRY
jgi:hypothetical protein